MNTPEISVIEATSPPTPRGSFLEVFGVFLRLGLTSFGGPIAHLGYFRAELVVQRKWVSEETYADLVALCQFLPGPSSSQVGISLGLVRAGVLGSLAAWLGFTLPSALAMTLFAYIIGLLKGGLDTGWIHGLLIVAVAVVAQAVWGMAKNLCPDRPRATLALVVAVVSLLWISPLTAIVLLALAGMVGWRWLRQTRAQPASSLTLYLPRSLSTGCRVLFFSLLLGLPLLRLGVHNQALALFDTFFRVGSLVFGGGHVVLPLLQHEVVPAGWISTDHFLTGYAAA
ncbi:MAG: chromate efflux transporter, partial [Ktedonobacteraceae bacterium]